MSGLRRTPLWVPPESTDSPDAVADALDTWYEETSANLRANHQALMLQLRKLEAYLLHGHPSAAIIQGAATHCRPSLVNDRNMSTPHHASPPGTHSPVMDSTIDQMFEEMRTRPAAETRLESGLGADHEAVTAKGHSTPPKDPNVPCHVLVQFKRKRILQYSSNCYVAPGEYVVVGGDRGEDIGLVTNTWVAGSPQSGNEPEAREGAGKVLRIATVLEVSQLQGVQTELENRAVEVAQEKVQEHGIAMRIVDAEYQFDRRKLTFYYQAQHRLDFRILVRDLYKTFRARIWMEQDAPV